MSERFHKKENGSSSPGALIGVLFVCATLCFLGYLFIGQASQPRRLWSPVVVDTAGKEEVLGDTRQLNFWTPSATTKDFLPKATNGEIADSDKWQVLASDDAVLQFGTMLHTNKSVLGYRRVEVWGQGHTPFKAGWWWTVSVMTNYSALELGHAYQTYWKNNQAVRIEVIDNRGRTD